MLSARLVRLFLNFSFSTPKGLEDVSSYPTLFAELFAEGWSTNDLAKLAGANFIRVMQEVENISDKKKSAGTKPFEDYTSFPSEDTKNCTSRQFKKGGEVYK